MNSFDSWLNKQIAGGPTPSQPGPQATQPVTQAANPSQSSVSSAAPPQDAVSAWINRQTGQAPVPPSTSQPYLEDLAKRAALSAANVTASGIRGLAHAETGLAQAGQAAHEHQILSLDTQISDLQKQLQGPLTEERQSQLQAQIADLQSQRQEQQRRAQALEPYISRTMSESPVFKQGNQLENALKRAIGTPDPARDNTWSAQLASAVGSTVPFLPAAVLGAPAVFGMGASTAADQTYADAKAHGADEATARRAASRAAAVGTSEGVSLETILAMPFTRFPGLKSKIASIAGKMVLEGAAESLQEGASQVGYNLIASGLYDPQRGWADGVTENMILGAAVGAIVGGSVHALVREHEAPPVAGGKPLVQPFKDDEFPGAEPPQTPEPPKGLPKPSDFVPAEVSAGVGATVGEGAGPEGAGPPTSAPAIGQVASAGVPIPAAQSGPSTVPAIGATAAPHEPPILPAEPASIEILQPVETTPTPVEVIGPATPSDTEFERLHQVSTDREALLEQTPFDAPAAPAANEPVLQAPRAQVPTLREEAKPSPEEQKIQEISNKYATKLPASTTKIEDISGGTHPKGFFNVLDKIYFLKSNIQGNPKAVINEYAANKIYGSKGLQTLFQGPDGTLYIGSPKVPIGPGGVYKPFDIENNLHVSAAKKDLALHVLTGTWDAIGLSFDNIVVKESPSGIVTTYYPDLGGSLLFRASGVEKSLGAFSENPMTDLQGFLDKSINPSAAMVYSDTTLGELEHSLSNVSILKMIGNAQTFHYNSEIGDVLKKRLLALRKFVAQSLELYNSSALVSDVLKGSQLGLKTNTPKPTTTMKMGTSYKAEPSPTSVEQGYFNDIVLKYQSGALAGQHGFYEKATIKAIIQQPAWQKWYKNSQLWFNTQTQKMEVGKFDPSDGIHMPLVAFHATKKAQKIINGDGKELFEPFQFFDWKKKGTGVGGSDTKHAWFFTDNPIASGGFYYMGKDANGQHKFKDYTYIKPVLIKAKNPYLVDFKGKSWDPHYTKKFMGEAKAAGHDAVVVSNIVDGGTYHNEIWVLKHQAGAYNIKSVYNRGTWDPKVKNIDWQFGGQEFAGQTLTEYDIGALRTALDQMGLGDVKLEVLQNEKSFQGLLSESPHGLFITIGNALNAVQTLGHEAIHAMRRLGVFDSAKGRKAWKLLEKEARSRGVPPQIQQTYAEEKWLEETIADMYGDYLTQPKPAQGALDRIKNFLIALKNWATGYGFTTPEQVFEHLMNGSEYMTDWVKTSGAREVQGDNLFRGRQIIAAQKAGVGPETEQGLQEVKDLGDWYNTLAKWGASVIQLADANAHIPWLQSYVQRLDQWYNTKLTWLSRANDTIAEWASLPEKDKLAGFIFDVEQMTYLKPGEVPRQPTNTELNQLAIKHEIEQQETIDLYKKIRKDFNDVLNTIQQTIADDIVAKTSNTAIQAIELAKLTKEFNTLRARPYFPHARFGDFTTLVYDQQNKLVFMEAYDSIRERRRSLNAIKKQAAKQGFTVSLSKLNRESTPFRGLPPSLLTRLRDQIAQNANLTAKQKNIIKHDIDQLLIQSSPAQSFKHHFARRKSIAGYSRDAMRAYADYFWHGANHIARLQHGYKLNDIVDEGAADISALKKQGTDTTKRVGILEYLTHHKELILNPKGTWGTLRSLIFHLKLGFNIKSAFVNLTQVPLVTWPHLSAIYGTVESSRELGKAYTLIRNAFRKPDLVQKKLSPQDFAVWDMGIKDGFLDQSMAMELAGIAEGSSLARATAGGKVARAWTRLLQYSGFMFQASEKVNRLATFFAAVNLARQQPAHKWLDNVKTRYSGEYQNLIQKQGWTPEEAAAFLAGKDAVRKTQFEYASWNRPRFMQGKLQSTILTFFMYPQNMLWFIGSGQPGAARLLLTLAATAGLMGLPGAQDLSDIVKWLAAKFGYDFDVDKEVRDLMTTAEGDPAFGISPDLILHGASRESFGLSALGDAVGLPVPRVDLSGSLSLGRIAPGVQAVTDPYADFNSKLGLAGAQMGGAGISSVIDVMKFFADSNLPLSDPKRYERVLPTWLKNIDRAARYMRTGAETTRTGAKIVGFNPEDPKQFAEILLQGMGFTPTRVSQAWEQGRAMSEAQNYWGARRSALYAEYDYALRSENKSEAVKGVLQALRQYNLDVPFAPMRISVKDLQSSAKRRQAARKKVETGRGLSPREAGLQRDVKRLYPVGQPTTTAQSEQTFDSVPRR